MLNFNSFTERVLEMESEEEKWEKLDAEFDHFVVDMKPFVLKLPHRSERQRCALWIRKLCEPSGTGAGLMGRKNRNLYAKLLLHMLRRGVLEGPFSHRPEPGTLKTLPSYMSIYFDEPNPAQPKASSPEKLPDWVMGELETGEHKLNESWQFSSGEDNTLVLSASDAHRYAEIHSKESPVSLDDSDIEARLNSWNLGLDMKTKMMEAKLYEEKLKLQQKHDADVQKILERKNNELEDLKILYRKKQAETEDTIIKLEKKVQILIRDCQVIRETKENQITELKKMCEQSTESLNNDWEKKLHNAVAEMEKEKFELQKRHTETIQELLEDTNMRLNKMEGDYMVQTQSTNHMIKELEDRVQQLTGEAENSNLQRQKLIEEKLDLERCYQMTCSELQELKTRRNILHKEKEHLANDYEKNVKLLKTKYDSDINLLKQEHALSASKTSGVIEELEQNICRLKQQVQESELQRKQQAKDQENKFHMERNHLKHTYEKKVHELQSELDKEKEDTQRKINKFEEALNILVRLKQVTRLQEESKLRGTKHGKTRIGKMQDKISGLHQIEERRRKTSPMKNKYEILKKEDKALVDVFKSAKIWVFSNCEIQLTQLNQSHFYLNGLCQTELRQVISHAFYCFVFLFSRGKHLDPEILASLPAHSSLTGAEYPLPACSGCGRFLIFFLECWIHKIILIESMWLHY
ncbi:Cep112 [Phodopus roborovskii]|uniref:Cep112 protein n=1 Tax=Phodopus roborovskii TaxID=109678 RepID=A0AAU9YNF5_PHORO|nr:Cep112 [Phodopus roborovskii]